MSNLTLRHLLLAGILAFFPFVGHAQEGTHSSEETVLRDWLVIRPVGKYGRAPLHSDALEAQIVAGKWTPPKAGDTITLPDGAKQTWETATAGKDGVLAHPAMAGGYAYATVTMHTPSIQVLEASGHGMVYVNGEPRVGDPYEFGTTRLPVQLHAGANTFLFLGGRGRLRAKLVTPKSEALLHTGDPTLPDLILGEKEPVWGAVLVLNASTNPLTGLRLSAACTTGKPLITDLPPIPPLTLRKVGFRLRGPEKMLPGNCDFKLMLLGHQQRREVILDISKVTLRVRRPRETQKRTFVSDIDGSVQYYAINPMQPLPGATTPPALFLTLHGASVEAIGQADAYLGKTWGHLVAPTNRRPFGFDWEDWGRLDALEVLDLAQRRLHTDPRRVYLTGHSMGGHGTWQIGLTYPERFAVIAPSAGWISLRTYAGAPAKANPDLMEALLQRASAPSDTLALTHNSLLEGVYVLHGDADDNVPVTEARTMVKTLQAFHHDLAFHEQPGAGHWWGASDEPGTSCVDWPPIFDMFARHRLPANEELRDIEFTTANPGVSAWCHWVGIEAQTRPLEISSVKLRYDPGLRRFSGTTANVARLALRLDHVNPGAPIHVTLDGQKLPDILWTQAVPVLHLTRDTEHWTTGSLPSSALKGPQRNGPFKDAFRHRMLFVYGTHGTPEENAWAFAKARYDAETFWYRGNASPEMIPDSAFDSKKEPDRGVILYGNADTNAAWNALLGDSPVQVQRGRMRIGSRELTGENVACLFLRPRPGSDVACVAAVSGTGLPGLRLTDRMPYFVSGVAYPDCIALSPEALSQGAAGVRVAGFFGNDWRVESGDFVWEK